MDKKQGKDPVQAKFTLSMDEREGFLTGYAVPGNYIESYIWFSVECASAGVLYLWPDEVMIAAEMARKAGMPDLAKRFEEYVPS